jgi:hypothetical protein
VTTPPVRGHEEFSANFDAADFRRFFKALAKRVGGNLAGKLGTVLLAEIASAPLGTDHSYMLPVATDGQDELIKFKYFIDDIDQVDVYLFGSRPFHRECLTAFETL